MKKFFSIQELAELSLSELPTTTRNIKRRADIEGWEWRKRKGRGGGREYALSEMPEAIKEAIVSRSLETPLTHQKSLQVSDVTKDIDQFTVWQRSVADARIHLLQKVEDLSAAMGRTAAIKKLIQGAKTGTLDGELQNLIATANAKSGKQGGRAKTTLSRATIYNWISAYETGGYAAMAPGLPAEQSRNIPDWAPALLELYRQPQKPSLAAVMDDLPQILPAGVMMPSYDQARRFLSRLSAVALHKGRMGPQALKSLKAFTRRSTTELWPGAVYTADGHTFKATVEHPLHGQPFRPEITTILDVHTRYVVGWSIGLAENSIGVLEALSHAIQKRDDGRKRALPAIWYTDNGPGFRAKLFETTATGFYDRWGITAKNSLAYNSQARGVIERFQQFWVKLAKSLDSYNARDMDKEASREISKITNGELKQKRRAPFDLTWEEFKDLIQQSIDEYNERPHSGLDRVRDAETKRRRHISPLEKWQSWEDEGGKVSLIARDDAADLFRPYERRKVARCEVQVLGNRYFSHDLEAWHGEQVMVGYDIHDATIVWVRDFENRLICTAELDGNARPYFSADTLSQAKSFLEIKADQRVQGRLNRIEEKRAEILAEVPIETIDVEYHELSTDEITAAERQLAKLDALEAPREVRISNTGRPVFEDDVSWAAWLSENPELMTEKDRQLLKEMLPQRTFQMLLESEGVDIHQLSEAIPALQSRIASCG